MTAADLVELVAVADAHASAIVGSCTRDAVRAYLAAHPELDVPRVRAALDAPRVHPGARWPAGTPEPGTCDP